MPAIDLSALNTTLGAKCQDDTIRTDIITSVMFNDQFENRINVMDGVIDEAPLTNALFEDPLAPMADPENISFKTNLVKPDARILKVKDCIMAFKINPWKIWNSYLGQLSKNAYKAKQLGQDYFAMPFEDFILMKIKEKAREKFYFDALFRGIRNNAGTSSADLFDGFLKKVLDAITATDVTPVATGAITATNVVEKLLEVYDALDEGAKGGVIHGYIPSQIFDWYARTATNLTNISIVNDDLNMANKTFQPLLNTLPLQGSNAILHREPGMGNSQRIVMTTTDNLNLGFNSDLTGLPWEVQKEDLNLKFIMPFKAGVEIGMLHDDFGTISVNDQA